MLWDCGRLFYCISKAEDYNLHEQLTINLWYGLSLNGSEYLVPRDKFSKQDVGKFHDPFWPTSFCASIIIPLLTTCCLLLLILSWCYQQILLGVSPQNMKWSFCCIVTLLAARYIFWFSHMYLGWLKNLPQSLRVFLNKQDLVSNCKDLHGLCLVWKITHKPIWPEAMKRT